MRFRGAVRAEFERRRAVNPRYSVRGFAGALGVHHATLSRLLRGRRAVPQRTVRAVGKSLGLSAGDIARFIATENAVAVVSAIRHPAFRPDCRTLAVTAGISIDNVNIALHTLLSGGRLEMISPTTWVLAPGTDE